MSITLSDEHFKELTDLLVEVKRAEAHYDPESRDEHALLLRYALRTLANVVSEAV